MVFYLPLKVVQVIIVECKLICKELLDKYGRMKCMLGYGKKSKWGAFSFENKVDVRFKILRGNLAGDSVKLRISRDATNSSCY